MTFYREFNQTNNKTDIGIKSAAGLYPKVLKQTDIVPDPRCMYFIFLISPKYGDKNIFLYDVLPLSRYYKCLFFSSQEVPNYTNLVYI